MTLDEFKTGDRVQLHPATDWWMRGARFGTVITVGRKHLTVRLDAGPKTKVPSDLILEVLDEPQGRPGEPAGAAEPVE